MKTTTTKRKQSKQQRASAIKWVFKFTLHVIIFTRILNRPEREKGRPTTTTAPNFYIHTHTNTHIYMFGIQ